MSVVLGNRGIIFICFICKWYDIIFVLKIIFNLKKNNGYIFFLVYVGVLMIFIFIFVRSKWVLDI